MNKDLPPIIQEKDLTPIIQEKDLASVTRGDEYELRVYRNMFEVPYPFNF